MERLKKPTIDALINLLEDEDTHVSTLAMEELLHLQDADQLVAELQEAPSARLRNRIHQLGNILNIRRARTDLIRHVETSNMTLWDGLLQINYQYNPRMNGGAVDQLLAETMGRLPAELNTVRLTSFMRSEDFSYTGEDILGADLYLIEDLLRQRVGSPILLSVLAHHLGRQANWNSTVVLFKGKHCLLDSRGHLVEPAEGWRITRLPRHDNLHPCGKKEIWLTILCQLYLSAMLEGRLLAIHRVGTILTRLCGGDFTSLPFPLGS